MTRIAHVAQRQLSVAGGIDAKIQAAIAGGRYRETAFQRDLVELARGLGWGVSFATWKKHAEEMRGYGLADPELDGLIFHPRIMYRTEPGWPDLTLVRKRDRRLIFAELKAEDGQLSGRQKRVLELLRCLETPLDVTTSTDTAISDREPVMPDLAPNTIPTPSRVLYGPRIQIFVWKPSDFPTIAEVLR